MEYHKMKRSHTKPKQYRCVHVHTHIPSKIVSFLIPQYLLLCPLFPVQYAVDWFSAADAFMVYNAFNWVYRFLLEQPQASIMDAGQYKLCWVQRVYGAHHLLPS